MNSDAQTQRHLFTQPTFLLKIFRSCVVFPHNLIFLRRSEKSMVIHQVRKNHKITNPNDNAYTKHLVGIFQLLIYSFEPAIVI